jgi:hypothetical protein
MSFVLCYASIHLSFYPFYLCCIVLYILLYILCVLWSLLFLLMYITVLAFGTQVQGPQPMGGDPTVVNKYHTASYKHKPSTFFMSDCNKTANSNNLLLRPKILWQRINITCEFTSSLSPTSVSRLVISCFYLSIKIMTSWFGLSSKSLWWFSVSLTFI